MRRKSHLNRCGMAKKAPTTTMKNIANLYELKSIPLSGLFSCYIFQITLRHARCARAGPDAGRNESTKLSRD
jgi:hypothetical protein